MDNDQNSSIFEKFKLDAISLVLGQCYSQVGAESFFASLKIERVQLRHYQTQAEAQQDDEEYMMMFYKGRSNILHGVIAARITTNQLRKLS